MFGICINCKKGTLIHENETNYKCICGCSDFVVEKLLYENPKEYKRIRKSGQLNTYRNQIIEEYKQKHPDCIKRLEELNNPQHNIPKCPTCGSTNIRSINGTEKAFNAAMFGLLGNKRKCQFECQNPNCRYRW